MLIVLRVYGGPWCSDLGDGGKVVLIEVTLQGLLPSVDPNTLIPHHHILAFNL